MGFLGGNRKPVDPDNEKCTLDKENQQFQCTFEDEDENGDTVRAGVVQVTVDENGEIVGNDHEFKGGFSEQEKEYLKGRTAEQLDQEINSGPLSGYSDGGL